MAEAKGTGKGIDDVPRSSGVTRRQALQLGAVTAGMLAVDTGQATAETVAEAAAGTARERSFDEGWRFFRGDLDGAQSPSVDDSSWRVLDLPHDWSIEDLPYATSTDGAATSDPSLDTVGEGAVVGCVGIHAVGLGEGRVALTGVSGNALGAPPTTSSGRSRDSRRTARRIGCSSPPGSPRGEPGLNVRG